MPARSNPFAPVARAGDGGRTSVSAPGPAAQPGDQADSDQPRDPARMNKADLVAWAKTLGLPTSGTKTELAARIRAAV